MTRINATTNLGSGATVAQLTLDQKVEGSNPSSPANDMWYPTACSPTTYGQSMKRLTPLARGCARRGCAALPRNPSIRCATRSVLGDTAAEGNNSLDAYGRSAPTASLGPQSKPLVRLPAAIGATHTTRSRVRWPGFPAGPAGRALKAPTLAGP